MNEIILYAVLLLSATLCAYRAMIARRILPATLWVACVSALTSGVLYLLGAAQVAVIELSVGAGLVTVLLVYAISVTGDDAFDPTSIVPKPLAFGVTFTAMAMLGALILPVVAETLEVTSLPLSLSLWQDRVLDVWVQMVLIFSGVLGMLGLLAEGKGRPHSGLDTSHREPSHFPSTEKPS
ncbi:MAG: Na(+)/H(+) antiporter subunit B [Chloroflexota bacterium]